MPADLRKARFLVMTASAATLGPSKSEVAFVGRSNVGKSSLLNALCHHRPLARTSSSPGRTQAIHVFETAPERWLVDLPGYGYAAVSEQRRKSWAAMIHAYLTGRRNLRRIYVRVDAKVGPTALDKSMVGMLRELKLPHKVVATKIDNVPPSRRFHRRREIAKDLELQADQLAWVSALKSDGIPELRSEVEGLLGP